MTNQEIQKIIDIIDARLNPISDAINKILDTIDFTIK
jgi:hypothetical protein